MTHANTGSPAVFPDCCMDIHKLVDPNEESDIDAAVTISDQSLDPLETESKLFRLRRSIDTRIVPIVIHPGKIVPASRI